MSFNYKDLVSRFPELSRYEKPVLTTMPIDYQRRAIGDMRYQEPRYKMPFNVDPERAIGYVRPSNPYLNQIMGFKGKGHDEDIIKQILLIGLQSLMAKSKRKKGGMRTCDLYPNDSLDKPMECLTPEQRKAKMDSYKPDGLKMPPPGTRSTKGQNLRARGKIVPTQNYGEIPPETEEQRRIRTMRTSGYN
jgi:hypothetical protein